MVLLVEALSAVAVAALSFAEDVDADAALEDCSAGLAPAFLSTDAVAAHTKEVPPILAKIKFKERK